MQCIQVKHSSTFCLMLINISNIFIFFYDVIEVARV